MSLSSLQSARRRVVAPPRTSSLDWASRSPRPARQVRPARDPALKHWLGAFYQFHMEDDTYIPVALRLAPEDIGNDKGVASGDALGPVDQVAADRGVYEVALRSDAQGERWVLIFWEIDVPGIQLCDCVDRDEAMALFEVPSKAAGRWHGVRLRPESRPW